MGKLSIFKKLKLYRQYKKSLSENKDYLNNNFNIRIDRAYRMYTILNVPPSLIGEEYSLKTSDINRISEPLIKNYTKDFYAFLIRQGLSEIIKRYDIKKVDKYSYLLVFGFSPFKSHYYYNIVYIAIMLIVISLSILAYFII